ncbi:MAG: hypothetical protein F6K65_21345 [Moorea sp. SIO3C2]|nr:hypothetical protein [Moorena sp. SIO3C2]
MVKPSSDLYKKKFFDNFFVNSLFFTFPCCLLPVACCLFPTPYSLLPTPYF